ncbi:hypothetical protein BGX31_000901, partial [Mortierella sp. GBA43]
MLTNVYLTENPSVSTLFPIHIESNKTIGDLKGLSRPRGLLLELHSEVSVGPNLELILRSIALDYVSV